MLRLRNAQKGAALKQLILQHRVRGQALVEFMLVLTLLLLLIFSTFNIMQLLLVNYVVNQATWAAANQAAIDGGAATAAVGVAELLLDAGVGTSATHAAISVSCGSPGILCRRYDPITVEITYQGSYWVPITPFSTHLPPEPVPSAPPSAISSNRG